MQAVGKLTYVYPAEQKTDKFKVQEFVLNIPGKFEQNVLFQCSGERCGIPEKYVGQNVTVHFDLQGRAWTDPKTNKRRIFNTLSCWKIEGEATTAAPAAAPPPPPQEAHIPSPNDDEFPF